MFRPLWSSSQCAFLGYKQRKSRWPVDPTSPLTRYVVLGLLRSNEMWKESDEGLVSAGDNLSYLIHQLPLYHSSPYSTFPLFYKAFISTIGRFPIFSNGCSDSVVWWQVSQKESSSKLFFSTRSCEYSWEMLSWFIKLFLMHDMWISAVPWLPRCDNVAMPDGILDSLKIR